MFILQFCPKCEEVTNAAERTAKETAYREGVRWHCRTTPIIIAANTAKKAWEGVRREREFQQQEKERRA